MLKGPCPHRPSILSRRLSWDTVHETHYLCSEWGEEEGVEGERGWRSHHGSKSVSRCDVLVVYTSAQICRSGIFHASAEHAILSFFTSVFSHANPPLSFFVYFTHRHAFRQVWSVYAVYIESGWESEFHYLKDQPEQFVWVFFSDISKYRWYKPNL